MGAERLVMSSSLSLVWVAEFVVSFPSRLFPFVHES